jgi:hypothetical protein
MFGKGFKESSTGGMNKIKAEIRAEIQAHFVRDQRGLQDILWFIPPDQE